MALRGSVRELFASRDPLDSLLVAFEQALVGAKVDRAYVDRVWPDLRHRIILHALKVQKSGNRVNAVLREAPSAMASSLDQVYQMLQHNIYLTSQYWRAAHHHIRTGGFSPDYPKFGERDLALAMGALSQETLTQIREGEPQVDFMDTARLHKLVKAVRPYIKREVYRRTKFLRNTDPALYSAEDLVRELECRLIMKLRNEPKLKDHPNMLFGWCYKVISNEIPNLLEFASSEARARVRQNFDRDSNPVLDGEGHPTYLVRETDFFRDSVGAEGDGERFELFAAVQYANRDAVHHDDVMSIARLREKAGDSIGRYLDVLFNGGDDVEFRNWFKEQEPEISRRRRHVEGDPEAIGPWIQRWLNLSTRQLITFLDDAAPCMKPVRPSGRVAGRAS